MFMCLLVGALNKNGTVTEAFDNRVSVTGFAGESDSGGIFVSGFGSLLRNAPVPLDWA